MSRTGRNIGIGLCGFIFLLLPIQLIAAGAPFAYTQSVRDITEKSAVFTGRVNANETTDTNYWFEWGIGGQSVAYETPRTRAGFTLQDVTFTMNGLAPETTYFYRLITENSRGRDSGITTTFTTRPLTTIKEPVPSVLTQDAKYVTETSATFVGYIAPYGSTNVSRWFEWGTTPSFGSVTTKTNTSGYSESFETAMSGLRSGTTYYVRAVGESAGGRQYGATKSFRTLGELAPVNPATPTPSPAAATVGGSGGTTAVVQRVSGTISIDTPVSNGWSASALVEGTTNISGYVFVEYGTVRGEYTSRSASLLVGEGKISVRAIMLALSDNTTYYVRGVIETAGGRLVSSPTQFTTRSATPTAASGATIGVPQVTSGRSAGGTSGGQSAGAGSANTNTNTNTNTGSTVSPSPQGLSGLFPGLFKRADTSGANNTTNANGANNVGATGNTNTTTNAPRTAGTQGNSDAIDAPFLTSIGTHNVLQNFWGGVNGATRALEFFIATESSGKAQSPVEYTIAIDNAGSSKLRNAVLSVILPQGVIYIGDNTNNEFLVVDDPGSPERTYMLKLGTVDPGVVRTITMMGMRTSESAIRDARARLEYLDGSGNTQVVTATEISGNALTERLARNAKARVDATTESESATESWSFWSFSSSVLGWVLYAVFLVLLVLAYRKGRAMYEARKAELEKDELLHGTRPK